jgi:hypothetical protein
MELWRTYEPVFQRLTMALSLAFVAAIVMGLLH